MAPARRGRKKKLSTRRKAAPPPAKPVVTPEVPAEVVLPKKRGRKPKVRNMPPAEEMTSNDPVQGTEGAAPPKKKRGRKPKAKSDIGRPPQFSRRPPKPRKHELETLNEEELQERRIEEEILKLSDLKEVLRLQQVQDQGSDAESVEGDINVPIDDDSDDDENLGNYFPEGMGICPRPAPRKGRGGNKFLKRNMDVEVTKEEVQEMCVIIKSTMRKSLTTNLNPNENSNLKAIEFSVPEVDNFQRDDPLLCIEDATTGRSDTELIVYNELWSMMQTHDQWLNSKSSHIGQEKNFIQELKEHRNSLPKQLYIEHLNWLSIMCLAGTTAEEHCTKDGVLAWLPNFQRYFSNRYTGLDGSGVPGSNSNLDCLLRIATADVMSKINGIYTDMLESRAAILNLVSLVEEATYDKHKICVDFEHIHDTVNLRNAKFDESSVWGLKPIRLALEPPYFKTEDGFMAVPMTSDAVERAQSFSTCFFKRDKQKWTTKDLQQLRTCIKETLHSKRLIALRNRYEALLTDSIRTYENQLKLEGEFTTPALFAAQKRSPGRPRKSLMEVTTKYGIIYPVIATLSNGIVIRSEITPRQLSDWRAQEEKKLKGKSYEELVYMENEKIDWAIVANKMVLKSRKQRSPEDCELAWRHEVHPEVNDRRWGVAESENLKAIYARIGNEWNAVAEELNRQTRSERLPGRTAYQCFFRIRNRISPPRKLAWNPNLNQRVLDQLQEHPGNWRLVAATIDDPAATKRQVIEQYKKKINPVLKNGPFSRVEDCLLLLTIEKLKSFLAREGHFGCLLSYLPWRCETTWRDRANNLFSDWIVPWTLEEDKMLLDLAKTMKRNWQKISEEFTSFKNRKGCLTRYKILKRRLKDERFNDSLEAYHEAYAMTRYNVFQYKHLREILQLLQKVKAKPLPDEHMQFVGLLRDREPSEVRLQHMLLTFDRDILDSTISSLSRYCTTRDNYWQNWISKHGKRRRTFDRRTFHPENPQSVASALHIRGLTLKDKEDIPNLSDFENEIYKYFARFRRTKALNKKTKRPYIPDEKTLAQWYMVSRLIATSLDELEDAPVKKKWQSLTWFGTEVQSISNIENNGPQKSPATTTRRLSTKKAVNKAATTRKRKVPDDLEVDQGGYILIPENKPMVKRGRRAKLVSRSETDPDYVVGLGLSTPRLHADDEGTGHSDQRRKSLRNSTRRVWSPNVSEANHDYLEFSE